MERDLELYDDLQIENISLNPTVLYNIKPIKKNSAKDNESISSFLIRLSNLHVVTIKVLLGLLVPELKYHDYREYMPKLNYDGSKTRIIINKLEEATGIEELENHTLIKWGDIISTAKSLRKHKAWCAVCFQEMQDHSQVIYEKLIWLVEDYKVCTEHCVELDTKCQYCMEPQKILPNKSRLGECLSCKKWLGRENSIQTAKIPRSDELFTLGEQLERFLHHTVTAGIERDKVNAALAVIQKDIVSRTHGDSGKFFKKHLNISYPGIWHVCNNKSRIALNNLLSICFKLNINIIDLVENDFDSVYLSDKDLMSLQDKEIKDYLCSVTESNEYISLRKITRIVRKDEATLLANHSELVNKIKEKNVLLMKSNPATDFLPLKDRDYNDVREYLEHIISALTYRTLEDITRDVKIPSNTLRKKFPKELEKIFRNNKVISRRNEMEQEDVIRKIWDYLDSDVVLSLQEVLGLIGIDYDNLSERYSYLLRKIEHKASKDILEDKIVYKDLTNKSIDELHDVIKGEISRITDKPKYLKDIAEELNIPAYKLSKTFPLLINELKHRNSIVSKQNTLARNKKKLREQIIKLHKEGHYPSIPRIKNELAFDEEELKSYRLQVFNELGICVNEKWYPDEIIELD